ncbi:MAG: glycosyltransferase [Candidatus Thorarchaeota archaeon]|nr:glycosyltransferase [Candidatus Thorarchaeota archaeon]
MRILEVVSYFPPATAFGGAPRAAYLVSKELARRGHDVVIATSDAKNLKDRLDCDFVTITDEMEIRYYRNIGLHRTRLFLISPQLAIDGRNLFKDFDVAHLHEFRTFHNVVAHHWLRKTGIPYCIQPRGSLPRMVRWQRAKSIYDTLFGMNLLHDASALIALSQFEMKTGRKLGIPDEKISVIPNGIDLSEFKDTPEPGTFRYAYNISDDTRLLLFVGRVHSIKGIDRLLRSLQSILRSQKNVNLIVVGPDGGHLGYLKSLSTKLGLANYVRFTGPLFGNKKISAYVDSDIVILPSRYETFPNVILEAFACSKPVLATDVGGIPDLVRHGDTGFLVRSGDVLQLARAIEWLLENPKDSKLMGDKANKYLADELTIEKTVDRLEHLYSTLSKTESHK